MLELDTAYLCTKSDYSSFQRYGWCAPKCNWFTWPDHPFRDTLSSLG